MKLFTFKLLVIIAIALIAPMIIPGPDGKPIMSIEDWIPHDLINSVGDGIELVGDTLEDTIDSAEGIGGSATNSDAIYSWRDERGVLHYSDTPIEGAAAVEVPENTLEIPSKNFVEHGMLPGSDDRRSGGKSILLEDVRFKGTRSGASADLADIEAMANGDFSNTSEVLKNLPELLEQARQARQIDPESRH